MVLPTRFSRYRSRLIPAAVIFGAIAGCVEPYSDLTTVGPTGTDDSDPSDPSSDSVVSTSGTVAPTTMDPTTSDGSETDDTTTEEPSTTDDTDTVGPACGDGTVDPDEECDLGADNSDSGSCTKACKYATCGDGLVESGVEVCDDGEENGDYERCDKNCAGLGPHCGDEVTQFGYGEECDGALLAGCLSNCKKARSCQDIKDDVDEVSDGIFKIDPDGVEPMVSVYCDMSTDPSRGFTYLKVDIDAEFGIPAKQAEQRCNNYGMQLFVPRDATHLESAYNVATKVEFTPVEGGATLKSDDYLYILGIYPVTPGISCENKPFNSDDCPQWESNGGKPFWVSGTGIPNQPLGTETCSMCSAAYSWKPDGTIASINTIKQNGVGVVSLLFMCDVVDGGLSP